jgi:hypothetical protein
VYDEEFRQAILISLGGGGLDIIFQASLAVLT